MKGELMKVNNELVGDRPEQVTEDYCVKVFNTGKAMQGYALWLAKTEVHKESKTGWQDFCEALQITPQHANRTIDFYIAQKEIPNACVQNKLPDTNDKYQSLKGKTPQEKAQNYSDIKKSTGKEKPSRQDIRDYNKQEKEMTSVIQEMAKEENEFNSWLDQQEGWENGKADKAFTSFDLEMLRSIPSQVEALYSHSDKWKKMYRTLAKVMHPDVGGSEEAMQFLADLNKLMEIGVGIAEAPMIKDEIEEMREKFKDEQDERKANEGDN